MNITLSIPLIEAYTNYCSGLFPGKPFSRKTLEHIHQNLRNFEGRSLYVSSFEDYLRLITLMYSKEARAVPVNFSERELDRLQAIIDAYDIERSKLYSLFLCSLFFASGKFRIAVQDFFSYFMSDKLDYSYQLVMTKEINELYADTCQKQRRLPMTAFIRAALFYYQHISPGKLSVADSRQVTITNASTGWKKFYIRGSAGLKRYVFDLKKTSGKTINCVINNSMYQFLSNMRETPHER